MKSRSAIMKRIKIGSKGKIKRSFAYTSHLALNKTQKQKRHLRKGSYISKSDYKRWKKLL